mgnify:CR=1 FL=1
MVKSRSEIKRDRLIALQADIVASRIEKLGARQFNRRMSGRGRINARVYHELSGFAGLGRYEDDFTPAVRQTVGTRA